MPRVTRRVFLTTASLAAAGASGAAWALRAQAQARPLKIGLLLPYSKVYAVLGESITQGMELAFSHENWAVAGRGIELVKEDDENSPQVGLRKGKKLIESDRVEILTGPVHSGILMALRDVVHETKTPMIVSNAGADAISRNRCSRWIFRASLTTWQNNPAMGTWVAKHIGKKVFLIAPNYQAGKDHLGAFKETFLASGGEIVAEDYPPLDNADYAPYLTKIRQANVPVCYAFFAGTDAVNFVKQYDQFGLKKATRLCGTGFMTEPDVLPAQGKAALGILTGHFYTPLLDNPANKQFVKEFREKYKKDVDGYAMQGYDTAQVIIHALKATRGLVSENKEAFIEGLRNVQFDSPRGRFRFDPKTQNVIQPFVYIREVREVTGGLNNVVIDQVPDVADPGTGCTLPA